jgi:xanthine dehydrogenase YagS FAD-binding subunit
MIKNFAYVKAGSLAEAINVLNTKGARLHAGGTDLLGCARDEIVQVEKVVSISNLKELKGISARPDGGLKIGAATTLADIASNASVREKYAVLAQSAAAVGSPQIREQGTIGGNLCQRPRCWYFRSDIQCLKKGGKTCYGMGGENQYHAILGGGPCFFVHPSDVGPALVALQAQVMVSGLGGNKSVRIEDFFVSPKTSVAKENILLPEEIITAIHLPSISGRVKGSYRKVRARGAWDFALASVAVVLRFENDVVQSGRIVLGGVSPYPWRVSAAEKLLAGKKLDSALISAVSEAAIAGAVPLRDNAYKVAMVKGAVEESLAAFA